MGYQFLRSAFVGGGSKHIFCFIGTDDRRGMVRAESLCLVTGCGEEFMKVGSCSLFGTLPSV